MPNSTSATSVSGWTFAVRQRRGALMQRVAVGAASTLAAIPLVGGPVAAAWGVAYLLIQGLEALAFAPLNGGAARMSRTRNVLGGLALSANTGLYGLLSLLLWIYGGAAGGVSAAIMLPAAMVYSMVNAPRSMTVLALTATPHVLYMAAFPFLLLDRGASSGAAITAAAAVTIFTIYCLNVWRGLAERLRREQQDRLLAETRVEQTARTLADQSAFLAAIGHDLRTPIGAILSGAAELRGPDANIRQNAELIADAGRMMKALLDDLLDHSRIEAGRMQIEAADFDLRAMLAQTLRLWRGAVEEKGLKLRIEGAHRVPAGVRGDAMRLRQVLNNLLSNAIKFTRDGEICLRLNAWDEEPGGYCLLIEVADTGPGMTPDQLSRLFTPFDQTADGVGARHGGSGLGLSISRHLVEMMGGRLTARSAPGEGARFTVSLILPRAEGVVAAPQPTLDDSRQAAARALAERRVVEAAPRPTAEPAPTAAPTVAAPSEDAGPEDAGPGDERPLRLLVVDDHDINRRAVQLILQPLGCDIVAAADGLAALARCEEAVFDVIFMDVRMPELDGRETTRRLRAGNGPNAATPVVAVTADTAPEDIAACQAAGMAYFVPKPLTPPALLGALQHVLEETQGPRSEAA